MSSKSVASFSVAYIKPAGFAVYHLKCTANQPNLCPCHWSSARLLAPNISVECLLPTQCLDKQLKRDKQMMVAMDFVGQNVGNQFVNKSIQFFICPPNPLFHFNPLFHHIAAPRVRCCLCAVGLLPAVLLFTLFTLVWLSELRLI